MPSRSAIIYTISSRGRPIGTTDLGFVRIGGRSRSGWFHPLPGSERILETLASTLPAMRAYLHRDAVDEQGQSLIHPDFAGSSLYADVAEALHHAGTLELTLHREDGSLIPTEEIGIQDMEQLEQLRVEADAEFEDEEEESWLPRWRAGSPAEDFLEEPEFPRYQVHLLLVRNADVP